MFCALPLLSPQRFHWVHAGCALGRQRSCEQSHNAQHHRRSTQNEWIPGSDAKKLYHNLEELQADLDAWLDEYNRTRPHSGTYCYGKTPMQTFLDSLSLAREKMLDSFVNAAPAPERSPEQRSAGDGASPATAA